jgi:hypothetical protein
MGNLPVDLNVLPIQKYHELSNGLKVVELTSDNV